jgi:putative endonuclease
MPARRCIVYLLESLSDPSRHYTGITSELTNRLAAHNEGHCPQTVNSRPWRVLVAIQFASEHSAALFERYLKSGSGRVFAKRHFV